MEGDIFNVGDQVIVRDWDDMAAEYGVHGDAPGFRRIWPEHGGNGHCFLEAMKPMCGTVRTVIEIYDSGNVLINDEGVRPSHSAWEYEPWAFIRVEDEVDAHEEISDDDFMALLLET